MVAPHFQNMKTVTPEEFEYQKTLAEIGQQIASGRAELENLAKFKDIRLADYEKELVLRFEKVLKQSQDVLLEATQTQEELTGWSNELRSFTQELMSWKKKLDKERTDLDVKMAENKGFYAKKEAEIEQELEKIRLQKDIIKKERTSNKQQSKINTDERRAIKDQWDTLLRTKKQLNND